MEKGCVCVYTSVCVICALIVISWIVVVVVNVFWKVYMEVLVYLIE
jgi:hypothetical protein